MPEFDNARMRSFLIATSSFPMSICSDAIVTSYALVFDFRALDKATFTWLGVVPRTSAISVGLSPALDRKTIFSLEDSIGVVKAMACSLINMSNFSEISSFNTQPISLRVDKCAKGDCLDQPSR